MNAKPQKIPGPDHPIVIARNSRRVIVRIGGRAIADTVGALTLREASYPAVQYIPRADVDMSLFTRTATSTWCPYKGEASYFTANVAGRRTDDVAWSYEQPFEAVAAIRDCLAFYPDRVDSIEESDA